MSALDAFFGRLFNNSVELELGAGINFSKPLSASFNQSTKRVDVMIQSEPTAGVLWVNRTFTGTPTGAEYAPFVSLAAAVSAAQTANLDQCVFMIAPSSQDHPESFQISGGVRYKFVELGYAGIPLVRVTGQVTWVMTNGAEISWEGCIVRTGLGAGPIWKDDGAAGTGAVHWNLIGGQMGVQTNGNAAAAPYTHNVKLRAAYYRANGFSELVSGAIQPRLDGFDTQCIVASNGQVQVTEGFLAGPGPYKCGFIRLRDANVAAAQTINTASSGSSLENAFLGAGTVFANTGAVGSMSLDTQALYYWAQSGISQTGTQHVLLATALQSADELTSGSFSAGAGSAAALDLLKSPRQLIKLNGASCAISVASGKYPVEPTTTLYLRVLQDATGSRVATWSADFVGTAPTLNAAANAETIVALYWSARAGKLYFL